jgi:hypothetical protein
MQPLSFTRNPHATMPLVSCLLLAGFGAFQGACSNATGPGHAAAPDGGQQVTQPKEDADIPQSKTDATILDDAQPNNPPPSQKDADGSDLVAAASGPGGAPATTTPPPAGSIGWVHGRTLLTEGAASMSGPGVTVSLDIAMAVKVVSQEELIAFIQNHRDLFTEQQLLTLTSHQYFKQRGYSAALLFDMLGLVFGGDMDYYRNNPSAAMAASNPSQQSFLAALGQLHNRSYTMKGLGSASSNSVVPCRPRFYAELTRLTFSDGSSFQVVNTRMTVTDQDGGSGAVASTSARPLELFATEHFTDSLNVEQGGAVVAEATTSLDDGEHLDMTVSKAVKCLAHDRIVAFIEEHKSLFSAAEYTTITSAAFYGDVTRTPDLLLALLGLRSGGGVDYFNGASKLEIAAYDQADKDLFAALALLKNESYTLTGTHTVVAIRPFATPRVLVPTVLVYLPDGSKLTVISTRSVADDKDGMPDTVRSQDGAPPLTLTPG